VRAAARTLGARLTFDETARLLALAGISPDPSRTDPAVGARSGAKLHLPGLLRAERSARELRLFREAPPKSPKNSEPL
jgi:tRNA(Ile)-lysidine synthase